MALSSCLDGPLHSRIASLLMIAAILSTRSAYFSSMRYTRCQLRLKQGNITKLFLRFSVCVRISIFNSWRIERFVNRISDLANTIFYPSFLNSNETFVMDENSLRVARIRCADLRYNFCCRWLNIDSETTLMRPRKCQSLSFR